MKLERVPVVAAVFIAHAVGLPAAPAVTQPPLPQAVACDRDCLLRVMDRFVEAMVAGKPDVVTLAQAAEVRENTKLMPLERTTWKDVKTVRSAMTFADVVTGNVVSRAGVELDDGRAGYLSTRLKVVADGRVTDVELSADTSPRVVRDYVWKLDPQFGAVLPPEKRLRRVALEALARRYFHALSSHEPVLADFDERCNRFHSGLQVTNVVLDMPGGNVPRSCPESMKGSVPWGPATEQRFPVIDSERGVVVGLTLLHYPKLPNEPQMYVSEVFKVVDGRIVKIDNIGLMTEGVATLGFTH